MIVNGAARGAGGKKSLADYLGDYLHAEKNAKVEVLEVRGSAFQDLTRTFLAWEAEAAGSRCTKPLWHAQISPRLDEFLTREQQLEAVNILEKHLGLNGQPRAIVMHQKKDGSEHLHVVWSRIRREEQQALDTRSHLRRMKAGTAISDQFSKRRNAAAAREMEERLDLDRITNPEFKSDDKTKTRQQRREETKSAPTYAEFQKAKRTGLDPRDRKSAITLLWEQSDSGKAFRSALEDAGYILAHGNRREHVVVDKAGDIHSLAKQIKNGRVAAVRDRLKDVDPASIPHALHVQQALRRAFSEDNAPQQKPHPRKRKEAPPSPAMPEMSVSKPSPFDKPPNKNPLDPATILAALTEQQSTFTRTDMEREIVRRIEARKNSPDAEPSHVQAIARSIRKLDDFISLGKDRTEQPRYTSREMLETELAMRNVSDDLAFTANHPIRSTVRDNAPTSRKLQGEQKQAYEHLTSGGNLRNLIGVAGTGKSFVLGAVREAEEADGYRVRGTAVSSMAAKSLQKGSNIRSQTLKSLLYSLDNVDRLYKQVRDIDVKLGLIDGRTVNQRRASFDLKAQRDQRMAQIDRARLTKRDVVVVDEAGMVGSRDLNALMQKVQKAGAKIILVGDAEQLQAIDAGGAFRALCDRHGATQITEVRRQKTEWQQQATRDFAQSFTADAMEAYRVRGYVHGRTDHEKARADMVAAWTKARRDTPEQTQLMMAFTRADVSDLNKDARAAYRAEGKLHGKDARVATSQGVKEFAQGDRMYFLQNDVRLNVMNGSLGTIEAIHAVHSGERGHRMTVTLDDGEKVTFNTSEYDKFSHGYAATIHKAQGATVDRAHLLASRFMDRHAAYVGMSRHRDRVDLYYSESEFQSFMRLTSCLSRDRRKDTTLDYLKRAENSGKSESFMRKLARAAGVVRDQNGERQSPARTLIDMLRISSTMTPEERHAQREAKSAAQRLRQVLDGAERKRDHGLSY